MTSKKISFTIFSARVYQWVLLSAFLLAVCSFAIPNGLVVADTSLTTAGATTATTTAGVSSGTILPSYCVNLPATFTNLSSVFQYFTCIIQRSLLPLLFILATLVFIWGTVKFMGSEESAEKEEGRQFMIWGIIALAVMFSVWGLVHMLGATFDILGVFPKVPVSPPSTMK